MWRPQRVAARKSRQSPVRASQPSAADDRKHLAGYWVVAVGPMPFRTALNKAYGVQQGLSFWQARIKVTLFTVIGTLCTVLVFSSVVILPYAWAVLEKAVGVGTGALWLRTGVRYGLAFLVLVVLYAALYGRLPDIRQGVRTVLPGALCTRPDRRSASRRSSPIRSAVPAS